MSPGGPALPLGALDIDLPLGRLAGAPRAAAARVRDHPTVRRPMEVRRIHAPIPVFERLLEDLATSARLVERIGAGRYRIEALEADGRFRIDDGAGASAVVDRLHRTPGERIYLARGRLHVAPLPAVHGSGLVTLRYEPEGPDAVRVGGQIFFRLESRLLHAIGRRLALLFHAVIDSKVRALQLAAIGACEVEARDAGAEK